MRFTLLSTFVLFALLCGTSKGADDARPLPSPGSTSEQIPTIRQIMQQSHRCRDNYIYLVRRGLQQEQIPWDEVSQKSLALVKMGQYLQQNTPPKGTREDWHKITSIYISHATLLADAAGRYDHETAVRHQTKMQQMCITCHRAHR